MKKVLLSLLALASVIACEKEEATDIPSLGGEIVKISPVITKVTDVNFEDGDRIGLSIFKNDAYYAENALLTFGDGVFAGDLVWYTEGAETSVLTAYYPYSASGMPETFAVQADQTEGYEESDLIAGTKSDVTPSSAAVTVGFKHLLSKIMLDIDNQSGSELTSVKLSGSRISASVDLSSLTVAVDGSGSAEDITMQAVTAGEQYRAIVIPQTVAFTLTVTTASGKTLTQNLASVDLNQGGQYTMSATVVEDNLSVNLSGEITNWTDEGEIGPATPSGEVQFEEYDGYFVYDGVTYPTVTLSNGSVWMAKNLSYLPDGYTPSADGTDPEAHILYPYELVNDGGTQAAPRHLQMRSPLKKRVISMTPMQFSGLMRLHRRTSTASREHRASALRAGMCRQGLSILLFVDFPTRMIQAPRPATRQMRMPCSTMPATREANGRFSMMQDGIISLQAAASSPEVPMPVSTNIP